MKGLVRYTPADDLDSHRLRPCSTDQQDLAAQRDALLKLGVASDRIYADHGFTGADRKRPGLHQALAAVRGGDTLVVPKLDRLARSVPDARAIEDDLAARGVRLQFGSGVRDPADLGRMHWTGDYSISDLAELFSISRLTVYRTLGR